MTPKQRKLVTYAAWIVAAAPAIAQLGLLLYTVFARYSYPYDLEWMEGGLLTHAQRITDGQGLYVQPSVDFIPYLYTPLYPGLLASFGSLFGISYQLGRAISIAALLGVFALFVAALVGDADRDEDGDDRPIAVAGAVLAGGFVAATYPWMQGWYDLVRADTLFVCMILGGLVAIRFWARKDDGKIGQLRIAAAATILGLSFFCKQTGVLYVATGGLLLLVLNWRRVPVYVAVTGALGLGVTWLLDLVSGGWFWTYVYEVHQNHDFNMDRFWASFRHILWKFPSMTIVIALALVTVGATAVAKRRMPRSSRALLVWSYVFAVSCLVGALGWGTQWAHFNAYMPAMFTGALAAGAAVLAFAGCARIWLAERWPRAVIAPPAIAVVILGAQLLDIPSARHYPPQGDEPVGAWWAGKVDDYIPSESDEQAGRALVKRLADLEGDVFMPYHPWYPHLAGKRAYAHRMGFLDMQYGNHWQIAGFCAALRDHRFAAIVLDKHPDGRWFPHLTEYYRRDEMLPPAMQPRVYTGADVVPRAIWRPRPPRPRPANATPVFDFESGTFEQWTVEGTAWGDGPVGRAVPDQANVNGFAGCYFADSMHGGDQVTGTLTSPEFTLHGARLTFLMSGGTDAATQRVELRIDGEAVRTATNEKPGEHLRPQEWDIAELDGKTARIVLIDRATGSWGHLNADEFVMWAAEEDAGEEAGGDDASDAGDDAGDDAGGEADTAAGDDGDADEDAATE